MGISPETSSAEEFSIQWPPDEWSKIKITEDSHAYYVNFEFRFALPIVELMANGINSIEVMITRNKTEDSYSYFDGTGDITSMEDSINNYFSSTLEKSKYSVESDEYSSYYYKEVSLMNFLSDQDISSMNAVASSILVTDGEKPRSVAVSDYSGIKRDFSYLERLDDLEELYAVTHYESTAGNTPSFCFKQLESTLSLPSCEVAHSNFPRPFTNEIFSGDSTSSNLGLIKVGDDSYSEYFWYFWANFFNVNESQREKKVTTSTASTTWRPIKLNCELVFEKTADASGNTGRQILISFLIRNGAKLKLRMKGDHSAEKPVTSYYPLTRDLNFLTMLGRHGGSLAPCEMSIINYEDTFDVVSVSNPNDIDVSLLVKLVGYNPETGQMQQGFSWSISLPAKSEQRFEIASAAQYPGRYYVGWQKLGIAEQVASISIADINTSTFFVKTVPGVAGTINPAFNNPKIVTYDNNNSGVNIKISSLPPWCDQIKWWVKPSHQMAAAAQRHPGKNRNAFTCFKYDPNPSDEVESPSGTAQLSWETTPIGNHEVVADLYQKGSCIDSIHGFFRRFNVTSYGSFIDFEYSIANTGNTDTITISTTVTAAASTLSYSIMRASALPETWREEITASEASSKLIYWYTMGMIDLDKGVYNELGVVDDSSPIVISQGEYSSPNRAYVVRLYACTPGCLYPERGVSVSSTGWTGSYYYNYSKTHSPHSQKFASVYPPDYSEGGMERNFAKIMSQAYSGLARTQLVSGQTNSSLGLNSFSAAVDSLEKCNFINWTLDSLEETYNPLYFIIVATYGGISAPVSWASWTGERTYRIADRTMYGALGTVLYEIKAVYPNGNVTSLSGGSSSGTSSVVHNSDGAYVMILGEGLRQ